MGKETAAREVLQWMHEQTMIMRTRQSELTGDSTLSDTAINDAHYKLYKKVAEDLNTLDAERLQGVTDKLNKLDAKQCGERLAKDKTLEKWQTFALEKNASLGANPDFKKAQGLVEAAAKSADPLAIQKSLAAARVLLWNSVGVPKIPQGDIPLVPGVSDRSARPIAPDKALAALQRDDLRKHIARNDTWGTFDPKKAMGPDASEQDLKVLWNIIESAAKADEDDKAWQQYQEGVLGEIGKRPPNPKETRLSTEPAKVYKELILGAGASASYYIANNLARLDIKNTLVIGKLQPWAKERGAEGRVNHPHNMIDPQHEKTPVKEHGSLAERSELSKRIEKVIDQVPNIQATIGKIVRCKGDYFEVQTDTGNLYAKTVVNALGIGGQKEPGEKGAIGAESRPKVKDMDTFKQSLDGGKSITEAYPLIKTIGVVGGNAAIDVITTVLRDKNLDTAKLEIHWLVGSTGKPAFLNGTDNALAEKAFPTEELAEEPVKSGNMTVYKGRFERSSGTGPITVDYKVGSAAKSFKVDLVVYGTGPDLDKMTDLFKDESGPGTKPGEAVPLAIEPVIDKDRHYNFDIEETDPDKLLVKLGVDKDSEKGKKILKLLGDPSLKGVASNKDDVIVGVKSKDGIGAKSSMQFVGASGARLTAPSTGTTPSTPMASQKHETVTSLPENVVGNDQLASARSRIEAQANAMPASKYDVPLVTEREGINLITCNQSVIATHIAACYPNIPHGLADYLTGQIIHARSQATKTGQTATPVPSPTEGDALFENMNLKDQVAFQARWNGRLKELDADFTKQ